MAEVSLPSVSESEDVCLTPAQVEALADAMGEVGPRYRALVWLGCYGGPRIGELLALRWSDLSLVAGSGLHLVGRRAGAGKQPPAPGVGLCGGSG